MAILVGPACDISKNTHQWKFIVRNKILSQWYYYLYFSCTIRHWQWSCMENNVYPPNDKNVDMKYLLTSPTVKWFLAFPAYIRGVTHVITPTVDILELLRADWAPIGVAREVNNDLNRRTVICEFPFCYALKPIIRKSRNYVYGNW